MDYAEDVSGIEVDGKREPLAPAWLLLAIVGFGAVWTIAHAQRPVTESDAWWHLRLGDAFRAGESLSEPAGLTPFASETWVPTQWLLEVIASRLVDWVGLAAVPWLVAAGAALVSVLLFAVCRRMATLLPATVSMLIALAVVSVFYVPRPQMATFVLLIVFVGAWLRTAEDLKPRWWLAALSYIWACAHGMWFVGPIVGLAVTLGLALEQRLSPPQGLRLAAVSGVGLVLATLTPVGPALLLAPFHVGGVSSLIVEWQPPDFREPYAALTLLLIVIAAATWSRAKHPAPWPHVLLLAMALACTIYSARTVPLGAIMAAPLAAQAMSFWLGQDHKPLHWRRHVYWVAALSAIGLLMVTVFLRPHPPAVSAVGHDIDAKLDDAPKGAVVFNEYALGGWVLWRHRQVTPVIDGLTESYSRDFIVSHGRTLATAHGWKELVRRTSADYALLYSGTPLALELREDWGWDVLADGHSPSGRPVVLMRSPPSVGGPVHGL